jgi:hypothetical protein
VAVIPHWIVGAVWSTTGTGAHTTQGDVPGSAALDECQATVSVVGSVPIERCSASTSIAEARATNAAATKQDTKAKQLSIETVRFR